MLYIVNSEGQSKAALQLGAGPDCAPPAWLSTKQKGSGSSYLQQPPALVLVPRHSAFTGGARG